MSGEGGDFLERLELYKGVNWNSWGNCFTSGDYKISENGLSMVLP